MRDGKTDRFAAGSRGARDAATMLPFIAIVLFFPPIILIFARPATLFGLPLIVVYIFAVWAIVIAAASLLSRQLGRPDTADDESD